MSELSAVQREALRVLHWEDHSGAPWMHYWDVPGLPTDHDVLVAAGLIERCGDHFRITPALPQRDVLEF